MELSLISALDASRAYTSLPLTCLWCPSALIHLLQNAGTQLKFLNEEKRDRDHRHFIFPALFFQSDRADVHDAFPPIYGPKTATCCACILQSVGLATPCLHAE